MEENFDDSEYLIISPPGVPYTVKWGIEAHFTCILKGEKEGDKEYSLLDFADSKTKFDQIGENNLTVPYRGITTISKNASPDVFYDLMTHRLKKIHQVNNTTLSKRILSWEEKVRATFKQLNPDCQPKIEWFVKTFTFIKLGYSTKYKRLAEICSLPYSLYSEFEEEYDEYISRV